MTPLTVPAPKGLTTVAFPYLVTQQLDGAQDPCGAYSREQQNPLVAVAPGRPAASRADRLDGRRRVGGAVLAAVGALAAGLAGCARAPTKVADDSISTCAYVGGGLYDCRLTDGTRCVVADGASARGITCDWRSPSNDVERGGL